MERENLELLRVNSTTFQDFPMSENHHHQPDAGFLGTGNHHHHQPDAGLFATGNHNHHQPDTGYFATGNHHQPADTGYFATGNHHQSDAGFWATGNHRQADAGFFATGSHHHQHDTDFLAAGNHHNGVPENHHLPPEISPYHSSNLALMNNNVHAGPRYPDTLFDTPLESEFARLSLTQAIPPPAFMVAPPSYDGIAASVGGGNSGSNSRNYSSVNLSHGNGFSYSQPQFSIRDIQRMRVQSAARGQMGLFTQPQNYPDFDNGENLDAFRVNSNVNGFSGYDHMRNIYNSGRSLNGAAVDYQPHHAFRNGFNPQYEMGYGSPLNLNRNNANFQYRSLLMNRIQPNINSLSTMSDWRNGSICRPRQRSNFSSLKDLRGKILLVAKDQYGCRFLQNKFEEGKPEEIQMIFLEVKDHVCELMVDQFGNYLIQKFFEVCNQDQMTQLLLLVINDDRRFKDVCVNTYGTRAVQKLLEHLTAPEQRSLVISVLRRITVALTKSMNGHHVIQHCLKFFSIEDNKHILNVVADNCLDIATDKSGCCVLQQCVEHALGEPRERLLAEITSNALILSEHPYGNYVVQYILGLKIMHATADIMAQLSGNYVSLSMNKYGSNVVERCLRESEGDHTLQIIEEIIYSPNFLRVLQDPYGNYVAQSALAMSKGAIRHAMIDLILVNYANLHSHPHGKRVLARTKGSKLHI